MPGYKVLNYFIKKPEYYFTLIDQIIISLCNFLVTIIILRVLGIEIFGQFSFLWLFLLLINSTQLSYIISPMLTNAHKHSRCNIDFYYMTINRIILFDTQICRKKCWFTSCNNNSFSFSRWKRFWTVGNFSCNSGCGNFIFFYSQ